MAIDPPYVPKLSAAVERAIGRFIVAWNVMEWQLDRCIHDMMRVDLDMAAKVTANLGVKAKLDLAHALYEELRDMPGYMGIPKGTDERFDALVNATAEVNGNDRNRIVHAQYTRIEMPTHHFPIMLKWAARKGGLRGIGYTPTPKILEETIGRVTDLTKRWHAIRCDLEKALEICALSDADMRRDGKPETEVVLHPPTRSRPNSPKAKSKLRARRQPKPRD